MGFWGSLGKTLLSAAPYVAAPFTGGASLLAAPMANKAVGAWNQRDANRGVLSGYDRAVGTAGNIAGLAGGMGAFGKMGSTFGAQNFGGGGGLGPSQGFMPSGRGGGWQDAISGVLGGNRNPYIMNYGGAGQGGGPNINVDVLGRYGQGPQMIPPEIQQTMTTQIPGGGGGPDWKRILGIAGGIGGGLLGAYGLSRAMGGGGEDEGMWGPQTQQFRPSSGGMGMSSGYDMSSPNLSYALTQGRNEAIANQPWRQELGIHPFEPIVPRPGGTDMSAVPRNPRQRVQ